MQQEYKKPLLIFIGSLIILVCLVVTFFLAFNYGRRSIYSEQIDLVPPTPITEKAKRSTGHIASTNFAPD